MRASELGEFHGQLEGFDRAEFDIDRNANAVRVTVPGFRTREAVYTGDQGCVILPIDGTGLHFTPRKVTHPNTTSLLPWPAGDTVLPWAYPAGVDRAAVDAALAERTQAGGTRGTVVLYKGQLIGEAYAEGWGPHSRTSSWSMTKTLTALQLGYAIQHGAQIDVHAPAPIPEWQGDSRREIRLFDSLQMSSGLENCALTYEDDRPFGDPSYWTPAATVHDWQYWESVDSFAHAANQELVRPPGTHNSYKNCDPLTLGRVIHDAVVAQGRDPLAFQYELLERISARDTVWSTDREGHYIASALTDSTPRDWARIGQLILQNGNWNGEQLLPEGWVSMLRQPSPDNPGYGGMVWLNGDGSWPQLPADAFAAIGGWGQYTMVIPSKDLVVVSMGFNPNVKIGDTIAKVIAALPQ
ncbi:serine hydrolase domain-containing protein [Nocardia rhizosphaerihabitans]|uniref:serine hydrolase domain-containing protein n=1 Tax=Nocardia rhizosphaerihabitans TaxID=1691570 RepID=UPI00366D2F5A